MSLKLITLAAFAATAQATPKVTACTAAQTEEMTTCKTKEMNLAMQTIKEEQTEGKALPGLSSVIRLLPILLLRQREEQSGY